MDFSGSIADLTQCKAKAGGGGAWRLKFLDPRWERTGNLNVEFEGAQGLSPGFLCSEVPPCGLGKLEVLSWSGAGP